MPLPDFDEFGDLPVGVHLATMEEVLARFGTQSEQRRRVGERLRLIRDVAQGTGKLLRLVVFGSFVTDKREPNDVDIAMVMDNDFQFGELDDATSRVFDHRRAQAELDASVFWIRPAHLFLGTIDDFIANWQVTRASTQRGIVEIKND